MRLNSFQIKNFRSVVDSGYTKLSTDNITTLIGQNESGKTSVLEALNSFYTGQISDDVLRSDNSLPEVVCSFSFRDGNEMSKIIDLEKMPEELRDYVGKQETISLKRYWDETLVGVLTIYDEKIEAYYDKQKQKNKESHEKLDEWMDTTIRDYVYNKEQMAELAQKTELLKKEINQSKQKQNKAYKASNDDEEAVHTQLIETQQNNYNSLQEQHNRYKEQNESLQEKYDKSLELKQLRESFDNIRRNLEKEEKQFPYYHDLFEKTGNIFARRKYKRKVTALKRNINELRRKKKRIREALTQDTRVLIKIFEGKTVFAAENEIKLEDLNENLFYTPETLAQLIFKYIPGFSFFEDFSSLLPDRIDMEDIVDLKKDVPGFQAVKNFITITNLDHSLFELENQRILKQKIETLNGEISLDFHDFWRQKLGKNNKIYLGFDLEHYDDSNPEKKGRPYLEFWIKDNQERLYPKQRSRGVRWFLSFYLELKAAAIHKQPHILLIDEPGLSLHARAQEDVLKVFEDIKSNVQIVYSTHSPHLIDTNKLYRIIAVQRDFDDELCTSTLLDVNNMKKATADTLTPIYSTMGAVVGENQNTFQQNNLIVEDIATFYILKALFILMGVKDDRQVLPSTGLDNIPLLANILTGWSVDFTILLPDSEDGFQLRNQLSDTLFLNDSNDEMRIILLENCKSIFDLFSTIDFKKHVLNERLGITEPNTDYIINANIAANQIASVFALKVQEGAINLSMFDYESTQRIKNIVDIILENT